MTGRTRSPRRDLPEGAYEVKVAHNLGWAENYGAGGVRDGANIPFSAPGGKPVTFSYVLATHVLTIEVTDPPLPGTGEESAHWIDARTIAWPAAWAPTPATSTFALHGSPTGGLSAGGPRRRPGRAAHVRPGRPDRRRSSTGSRRSRGTSPCGCPTGRRSRSCCAVRSWSPRPRPTARSRRRPGCRSRASWTTCTRPRPPSGRSVRRGRRASRRSRCGPRRPRRSTCWCGRRPRRRPARGGEAAVRRLLDGRRQEVLGRCAVPLGGHGVRADDRPGRGQPGHGPVLGGAHAELDALGAGGPGRQGLPPARVGEGEAAGGAARRPDDLRAARAGLLDQRPDGAGRQARHVPGVRHATATAARTCGSSRRRA